jgi:hypothetical protein
LLRVFSRIGICDRICNVPVGTDYIRNPLGCAILFRFTSAISDADLPLGVTQERVRKEFVIRKLLIRSDIIGAATENLNILPFKIVDSITESLALSRSATGAGTRVKPHHDSLAFIVTQPNRVAFVIENFKVRGLVPYVQHCELLLVLR